MERSFFYLCFLFCFVLFLKFYACIGSLSLFSDVKPLLLSHKVCICAHICAFMGRFVGFCRSACSHSLEITSSKVDCELFTGIEVEIFFWGGILIMTSWAIVQRPE